MLKEIKLTDIGNYDEEDVLIIYNEGVYTTEEFKDIARFLVDEEEPEEPEEEESEKRIRRSKEEIRKLIQEAVDDGCTNAFAVSKHTGLSYKTVRKYMEETDGNNNL